jgi:hypothetical protein
MGVVFVKGEEGGTRQTRAATAHLVRVVSNDRCQCSRLAGFDRNVFGV